MAQNNRSVAKCTATQHWIRKSMQTEPEKQISPETITPWKRKRDPRNLVTPDAFKLSDEVLGKPLATPKRRALAIFIDLLIIQQLSQMGSVVLGLCVAGMLFLLSAQKKSKSVGRGFSDYAKYLGIAVLVGIVSYEIYRVQTDQGVDWFRTEAPVVQAYTPDRTQPLEQQLASALNVIEDYEEQDKDLIDLMEQMAAQLGYGFGWAAVYFTLCLYLSNGQTFGKWICRIKVVQLDGERIGMWSALGRYGGYAASFVTGLSGFFQIYWDANRQGLHDKVSSTVVICLRRDSKLAAKSAANQSKQDTSSDS